MAAIIQNKGEPMKYLLTDFIVVIICFILCFSMHFLHSKIKPIFDDKLYFALPNSYVS